MGCVTNINEVFRLGIYDKKGTYTNTVSSDISYTNNYVQLFSK